MPQLAVSRLKVSHLDTNHTSSIIGMLYITLHFKIFESNRYVQFKQRLECETTWAARFSHLTVT